MVNRYHIIYNMCVCIYIIYNLYIYIYNMYIYIYNMYIGGFHKWGDTPKKMVGLLWKHPSTWMRTFLGFSYFRKPSISSIIYLLYNYEIYQHGSQFRFCIVSSWALISPLSRPSRSMESIEIGPIPKMFNAKLVWLVVWLPSFWHFPINIKGMSYHPNWRSHIFQRGGKKPPTSSG